MQVHGPSDVTDHVRARMNNKFAVLEIGQVEVFVYTSAEADELIKAAVAVKDMLLAGENSSAEHAAFWAKAKHGEFSAGSAAEVAEGVDVPTYEPDGALACDVTHPTWPQEPTGHLPQHKGAHPACTLCDEPGHHHLHAVRGESS